MAVTHRGGGGQPCQHSCVQGCAGGAHGQLAEAAGGRRPPRRPRPRPGPRGVLLPATRCACCLPQDQPAQGLRARACTGLCGLSIVLCTFQRAKWSCGRAIWLGLLHSCTGRGLCSCGGDLESFSVGMSLRCESSAVSGAHQLRQASCMLPVAWTSATMYM